MLNPRLACLTLCLALAVGTRPVTAQHRIEDLGWIAGHWAGPAFDGDAEEGWFAPAGRAMSGVFRLVRENRAVVYELLLIEQDEDDAIHFRFKHVGPGWEPWEDAPLEYRLTELAERRATFRTTAREPEEGTLEWFTYERPDEDRLVVTLYGVEDDPIVLELKRR